MSDAPKSAQAFRTIGEVAAELGVAQHVLRFWESRFPQVQPMKRGGNRRYYRPADVALLRDIHRMLHAEGYTIKGVQRLLESKSMPVRSDGADAAALPPVTSDAGLDRDGGDKGGINLAAIRAVRNRLAGALAAARA